MNTTPFVLLLAVSATLAAAEAQQAPQPQPIPTAKLLLCPTRADGRRRAGED
jgi:hypothetical protein